MKYDSVALFLDGKSFTDDVMIIVFGVTVTGEKIPLGFIPSATENERVVKSFLSGLLGRGLNIEEGILRIIDGAKGPYSANRKVFTGSAHPTMSLGRMRKYDDELSSQKPASNLGEMPAESL